MSALTMHNTHQMLTDLSNALDPEEVDDHVTHWAATGNRLDYESPEAETAFEIHDELFEIAGLVYDLKEAVDNLRQLTGSKR